MANIAIEVKVGNDPNNFKKGCRWYFSTGKNTKISINTIMDIVSIGIENEFKRRGMKDFIDQQEIIWSY